MSTHKEMDLPGRQSGMEAKHEEWVLEVLNFLHLQQVDVYEGGWNTRSSEAMNLEGGSYGDP